jgi:hypothetical protein
MKFETYCLVSVLKLNSQTDRPKLLDFVHDSAVGIATAYGLNRVVPVGSRIFSSPRRPGRIWGSPSLLSKGYRGFFPRG